MTDEREMQVALILYFLSGCLPPVLVGLIATTRWLHGRRLARCVLILVTSAAFAFWILSLAPGLNRTTGSPAETHIGALFGVVVGCAALIVWITIHFRS